MINYNGKMGFTCSAWDLLHAGHVLMLREAKQHCDFLVVGLQVDPSIDRPNKNKPVQTITERYLQLQAVKYVNEIIPYSTESDLEDILRSYPINVRFVGEEYKNSDFTGKEYCLNNNIEIYYNKRQHSFSTTSLRNRVKEAETSKG